jgi:hypothetical protein
MKLVTILTLMISLSSYCQTEPSKNLPPIKMLPKTGEVKQIYELPKKADYKVYNSQGKLVTAGNAQFVDYTDYKKGVYFILVGDKKERFEKK